VNTGHIPAAGLHLGLIPGFGLVLGLQADTDYQSDLPGGAAVGRCRICHLVSTAGNYQGLMAGWAVTDYMAMGDHLEVVGDKIDLY
jgi:hypothetical protein